MSNMTKTARKLRCQAILRKGEHRVCDDDHQWLMSHVFPFHPDWSEKQGSGVSNIYVRRHARFSSIGFFIERTDGTEIDISYKVAVDGRGSVWSQLCAAARAEVHPQMAAWRMSNPPPCDGMHQDHRDRSFDDLFRSWLAHVALEPEEVSINSQRVGFVSLFHERALALSWQRFHQSHATYQWLTAADNIRKGNRGAADSVSQEELFETPF